MRLTLLRHLDESGQTDAHVYTWYVGVIAECKTDEQAKARGEKLADAGSAAMSQSLAEQSKFSQPVYKALIKYLTGNGEGMTPEEMSLLNSQFLNQNTQQFNSAGSNVRNALLTRGVGGGDQPIGGTYVRGISNLEGLKGATTAAGLRDIQLANIQQRLTNRFNAANVFAGTAGQYGQQGVGYGGVAAGGIEGINKSHYIGPLEGAFQQFAGGLGQGVGKGISGGLGKLIGGSGGSPSSGGGMSG